MHLSDIHFDALYGKYPETVRIALKKGIRNTFEKAMDFAINEELDLVILSGDICDRDEVSYRTERFVRKQFVRLHENHISVIVLHGNHDPSSQLAWRDMPENVHIIKTAKPETIHMTCRDQHEVYISCNGFEFKAEADARLEEFPERREGAYNIGALHSYVASLGADGGHDPYMTSTLRGLISKHYDYWALGHIHKAMIFPDAQAAYSGCIQGLNANETGPKGGYIVEIESPGSRPNLEFINLTNIQFETIELELDAELDTLHEITGAMLEVISALKIESSNDLTESPEFIIRIKLSGMTPLYNELKRNKTLEEMMSELCEEEGLLYVEIKTEELMPFIDKSQYVKASPFVHFIDQVLGDSIQSEAFIAFASEKDFIDMPSDSVQARVWLKKLIDEVGDEWFIRLVKTDEN